MGDELTETIQAPTSGVGSVKDSVYVVKKKESHGNEVYGYYESTVTERVWGVFSTYQKAWKAIACLAFIRDQDEKKWTQVDAATPNALHPYSKDGVTFEVKLGYLEAEWVIEPYALDAMGDAYIEQFDILTDVEDGAVDSVERTFRDARHALDTIETARGWCDRDGNYPGSVALSRGMLNSWIRPLRRLVELFVKCE